MTAAEALSGVSDRLIKVLPPAMTLLIVLNVLFLGVSTYVFGHNATARNEMLAKVLDKCLEAKR